MGRAYVHYVSCLISYRHGIHVDVHVVPCNKVSFPRGLVGVQLELLTCF